MAEQVSRRGLFPVFGLCGLLAAGEAWAQAQSGHEDFTFRRITVSPQADGPRITVQIDPEEQARRLAVRPRPAQSERENPHPQSGAPPPAAQYGWFWDRVDPALAATDGRFLKAIAALGDPPQGSEVPRPRLQALQNIAASHGPDLLRATAGTRVSPALALAVISVESAGQSRAVSSAGAEGLMQLIPATATRFGVSDSFDAPQNIRGGVAYLDWLMGHFESDVVLVLAAYNAGEGAVRRNSGVPPFAETRDYVPKVLAAWLVARGLCLTPPELPSDGCVFRVGQAG